MRELDIELKPSKQFLFLLILMTCLSLPIINVSELTLPHKILFSSLVLLYGLLISIQHLFFGREVTRVIANEDEWRMGRGSLTYPVRILGESTLSGWVCVIRYKSPTEFFKRTCLVFRDCVQEDEYRRLRVALRFLRGSP